MSGCTTDVLPEAGRSGTRTTDAKSTEGHMQCGSILERDVGKKCKKYRLQKDLVTVLQIRALAIKSAMKKHGITLSETDSLHCAKMKWTPLHVAASLGLDCVVGVLGASDDKCMVDAVDAFKMCPLAYMWGCNARKIAEHLVGAGADVCHRDKWGAVALHYANGPDVESGIDFLITEGVDINTRDKYDNTPMHYVCSLHRTGAVDAMCKHGADLSAVNKAGMTPLMYACIDSKSIDIINSLIVIYECDVYWVNTQGYAAIHIAAKYRNWDAFVVLYRMYNMTQADTHGLSWESVCELMPGKTKSFFKKRPPLSFIRAVDGSTVAPRTQ